MDKEDGRLIVTIRGRIVVPGRGAFRGFGFLNTLVALGSLNTWSVANQCRINIGFPIRVCSESKRHALIIRSQHVRLPMSIRCG